MKADIDIYNRFRRGDEAAVTKFYEEHKELFVKTIAKKNWGTPEDATRIYPECVTILYYNIKDGKLQLPLKASLTTYLITLGRNVMSNERRKTQHRTTTYMDPISLPEGKVDLKELDYIDYREEATLMRKAMNSLGDACAQLIEWSYIKGYTTETIAEKLDIEKVGTVRKRKHDCLKKLKKIFKDYRVEIERYI